MYFRIRLALFDDTVNPYWRRCGAGSDFSPGSVVGFCEWLVQILSKSSITLSRMNVNVCSTVSMLFNSGCVDLRVLSYVNI